MQHPYNQHQNATNAYSNNKAAGLSDPRTLEAQALLKAASKLDAARALFKDNTKPRLADLMPALEYHKKLWIVFADSAGDDEHGLPQEIKNNIGSLAVFMFKRVIDIMAEPKAEKFDVMIEINRQIASGLMKTPPKESELESTTAEAAVSPQASSKPLDPPTPPEGYVSGSIDA